MRFLTKSVLAVAIVAATAVIAGEATDPTVKARQELMERNGAAMKTLSDMAKGTVAFDATAAEAAKAVIVADAGETAAAFEAQATDPESEAKAEIWTNWDDFVAKADALKVAAEALDATTLEGVQAGLGPVGGACGACHKAYKS